MTEYPHVEVTEITTETNLTALLETQKPKGVNLGDAITERRVNSILQQMRSQGGRRFLLSWTGSKIPHGANVRSHIIGWTQHGIVTTVNGEAIGTYDRLVEFGGSSGNEQLMLIYLYP